MMNFTNLLASIKVSDILKESPPASEDNAIITKLRSDPPGNTADLYDLISKIQPIQPQSRTLLRGDQSRKHRSNMSSFERTDVDDSSYSKVGGDESAEQEVN